MKLVAVFQQTHLCVQVLTCTLDTAHWTLHTTLCWFGNVHCTLNTAHYTLLIWQCTLSAHYTLHTARKIIHTAHFTQLITKGNIYTEEYPVNTTHCTWPLCTAQRTLHTNLWTLHTSYKLLNTAHCKLLTTHYKRQVCVLPTDNKHIKRSNISVLVKSAPRRLYFFVKYMFSILFELLFDTEPKQR